MQAEQATVVAAAVFYELCDTSRVCNAYLTNCSDTSRTGLRSRRWNIRPFQNFRLLNMKAMKFGC